MNAVGLKAQRILPASPFPSMKPQPAQLSRKLIPHLLLLYSHLLPLAPYILSLGPLRVQRIF